MPNSFDALFLYELPNLESLDALAGVSGAAGELVFSDLPALQSLQGLAGLERVFWIELSRTGLANLAGLENLDRLEGGILIAQNPALTSLRALTGLTGGGALGVTENPMLPGCDVDWLLARSTWLNIDTGGNDDDAVCPP